ncbi:MAG: hypothetical protein AAFV62_04605 [Pseudomonadota bacterium]
MTIGTGWVTAIAAAVMSLLAVLPARAEEDPVPDLEYQLYGESRAFFDAWLAACRPGGYCSVLTYNGAGPDAAGVDADYILRVGSEVRGIDYQLTFTGVAAYVGDTSPITTVIDATRTHVFEPDADLGWYAEPDGGVNDYRLSQSVINLQTLPQMKRSEQINVSFLDNRGQSRVVPFSLVGLTKALTWIEQNRLP